jgi:hypothetical protein
VAETNGLLNRRTDNSVPRVRIPPSPPACVRASLLFSNKLLKYMKIVDVLSIFVRTNSWQSNMLCGAECGAGFAILLG